MFVNFVILRGLYYKQKLLRAGTGRRRWWRRQVTETTQTTNAWSLAFARRWLLTWYAFVNLYIFIYICIYAHAHAHTDTHTSAVRHSFIHTDMHTNIHAYLHTYIHTYKYTYIYTHTLLLYNSLHFFQGARVWPIRSPWLTGLVVTAHGRVWAADAVQHTISVYA